MAIGFSKALQDPLLAIAHLAIEKPLVKGVRPISLIRLPQQSLFTPLGFAPARENL